MGNHGKPWETIFLLMIGDIGDDIPVFVHSKPEKITRGYQGII
jgi:hypothetical protein